MEELKALLRQTNFRTHLLNLLGSFAVCAIDQKRSLISKSLSLDILFQQGGKTMGCVQ